jgi:hypothetical protein
MTHIKKQATEVKQSETEYRRLVPKLEYLDPYLHFLRVRDVVFNQESKSTSIF